MARNKSLSVERFRLLLAKLRDDFAEENGTDHGWIGSVARRIGRDQSLISTVWRGTKGVGPSTIEATMSALGLPSAFFLDAAFDAEGFLAGEVPYHDADSEQQEPEIAHPYDAALREFEANHGHRFSREVLAMLRSSAAGRHGLSEGALLDLAKRLTALEADAISRHLGPPTSRK